MFLLFVLFKNKVISLLHNCNFYVAGIFLVLSGFKASFTTFDPDDGFLKSCKEADFIFAGERHDVIGKFETQVDLIELLYKKAGVRVICLEYPYSRGILVHEYLKTGDNEILDSALNLFTPGRKLDSIYYIPAKSFYTRLYKFNTQLPQSEKLAVEFIDVENTNSLANSPAMIELYKVIGKRICDSIIGANNRNYKNAAIQILNLVKDTLGYYMARHPNDHFHVNKIIDHYEYIYEENTILSREKHLFNIYCGLKNKYPGKKIFTQIGSMHIRKNADNYAVVSMLNQFKYKTLSICLSYKNIADANGMKQVRPSLLYDQGKLCEAIRPYENYRFVSTHEIPVLEKLYDYALIIDEGITADFLR